MSLTLTPPLIKYKQFISGLKYINNQGVVKFCPFKISCEQRQKVIFQYVGPTVSLNFDLLNAKHDYICHHFY